MTSQTDNQPSFSNKKTDAPQTFLRAARAGNLQKITDLLSQHVDINTSNPNGLTALHLASKEGHVNVVTELLRLGANVNAATNKGNTVLHIASLAGQYEVAKLLIENGAQVNMQSQNGFTPLYMAAQDNHTEVVRLLLANGANQSLSTDDGFTPLAVALQQGHERTVALLLEKDGRGKMRLPALHIAAKKDDVKAANLLLENKDCNVNEQSYSGFAPLHIAAHYGNVNIASLLIERGADVNYQARNNIAPLHVGAKWGNLAVCQRLVKAKADLETKTLDGLTSLHCAARSGHDAVVDFLLSAGASFSTKTKNGLTALHIAAQGDHLESARLLINRGANVNETTVDYLTPIHVTAHCGSVKVCKLLLEKKCDSNARALNGFTPLHVACKKNRIKIIELLLKFGVLIDATTESGLTPLHVAAFMGHDKIVVLLLQHGANANARTMRSETPLHLAVRANQLECARLLMRNNADVDAKARDNQTPLHIAARLGNAELVGMLLDQGANPDNTTKDNYTALHIAAKEGHVDVAQQLIDKGNANIESPTKNGFTPLHIASKFGHLPVAKLLLERGAQVNATGRNDLTPLHVAIHYGNDDVAQTLLQYNASPHSKAKNGYTPLHIAVGKSRTVVAKTLLDNYGADPNACSSNGFTPLHLAAQEGSDELARLLLQKHADVNAKASNGLTPLHLSAQEDHVNVAKVLDQEYNCELTPRTKAGYTPLHTATHCGKANMVRYLLGRGAPVNDQTLLGSTALHLAAQQGHLQPVYALLESGADPNYKNAQDMTAAHVARRQHYLNIFELLKGVTTTVETWVEVEEEVITRIELERPDLMSEHPVSDWEDDGAEAEFTIMPASPLFSRGIKDSSDMRSGNRNSMEMSPFGTGRTSGHYTAHKPGSISGDESIHEDVERDYKQMLHSEIPKQFGRGGFSDAPNVSMDWDLPPDNVPITRKPITSGFLVSFLVDARGGSMRSSRYSGLRILVPSSSASAPIRITCRMQRQDRVLHPPQLNDGDGLACRILEMGPPGYKFNSPVLLEVPHYASLRSREREVIILRCDDGETWKEHTLEATEQAVNEAVARSFSGALDSESELQSRRIVRILTTDFPQYFALVTRLRQETAMIGAQGGLISSTVVPQVQAVFPPEALQKRIRVGLQAQPIHPETVLKLFGTRVAVSAVVTVEPRRRKFHKPITLTIPLPRTPLVGGAAVSPEHGASGGASGAGGVAATSSSDKADKTASGGAISAANLRLLCSITGGTTPAHWEDITGSTPLSRVKDCISFTTTVSARFWLIDCQNIAKSGEIAQDLYRESIFIPYMGKFVVFSKRFDQHEASIRCFCITDDKIDKTLECQEGFELRAASPEVEVQHDRPCWLEFGSGSFVPVAKQTEMLSLNFQAFHENRLGFHVRVKNADQEVGAGKIAFMRESRQTLANNDHITNTVLVKPLCTLEVPLQKIITPGSHYDDSSAASPSRDATGESKVYYSPAAAAKDGQYRQATNIHTMPGGDDQVIHVVETKQIARSEIDLGDVANYLECDWPALARELGLDDDHINAITRDNACDKDRAHAVLVNWQASGGSAATGNDLERALRRIGREDVIKRCMRNIAPVTHPDELAEAQQNLGSTYPNTIVTTTTQKNVVAANPNNDDEGGKRTVITTTTTTVTKKTLGKSPIESHTKYGTLTVDGDAEFEELVHGEEGDADQKPVEPEHKCDHDHDGDETIHACVDPRHPVAVKKDSPTAESKQAAYLDLISKFDDIRGECGDDHELCGGHHGHEHDGTEVVCEEEIEKTRAKTPPPPANITAEQLAALDKLLE